MINWESPFVSSCWTLRDSVVLSPNMRTSKVDVHHVLELLPLRGQEQDHRFETLLARGAIEEEYLMRLDEDQSFDFWLVVIRAP
jgi:hypothetical protein